LLLRKSNQLNQAFALLSGENERRCLAIKVGVSGFAYS
jgi:hypothetical protein